MRNILLAFIILSITISAGAQKKVLDHSVYDSWQSVASVSVSDDGRVAVYRISPQEGDSELVFENLADGRKLTVPRGSDASLTLDSKWAVFKIAPFHQEARTAKIKKKKPDQMPKDSLAYVNLETFEIVKFPSVDAFNAALEGDFVVAYEIKKEDVKSLVVTGPGIASDTLRNVDKYTLERRGEKLAVVFKKHKKDSLSSDKALLYTIKDLESPLLLSEGLKWYGKPKFNDSADKLALLASADSNSTGSRSCSVILCEDVIRGRGRKAHMEREIRTLAPAGIPDGWCIGSNSPIKFSRGGGRMFVGISEIVPPDDTTLVDFETAKLDIWNYDIYMTPPIQKMAKKQLQEANRLSVIDLKDGSKLVPLAETLTERTLLVDGADGDYAVSVERAPYELTATWDENAFCDVSLVSLSDGSRKPLFQKLNGMPGVSPLGNYLVWYSQEDLNWYSYRISDGRTVNLTAGLDGMFYNDEDDHPAPAPAFDSPKWLEGDKALLLTDKFDIYRVSPDGGNAVCLTGGEGRKNNVSHKVVFLSRNPISGALSEVGVARTVGTNEKVWFTVFDRISKQNGYACTKASGNSLEYSFSLPKSFANVSKSFGTDVVVYRKGDFTNPMDAYVTSDFWKTERKLTGINPQQADYNWGNVKLVHWTSYDGTALDGILITPENLDTTAKYPMIAYFYEKNSQNLFAHYNPVPSRSVINFPFYASRGYVIFIPDIVYKTGHPGESAYNCICSGVEAMCRDYPFIDKSRMGIQGQSWGGYQVAYLVTRTDMFAAAGAGAPVGNMTSAYGGIRWGSGHVRAMQYEHGQSRIGCSLWDEGGLDLYVENSPIFHTQNVSTPVLIMHNDDDGAVPWYQGIEFFMALRRFGHPSWLLQYNGEAHNLSQRKNSKDLSVRLQQFFDHYLKGEPMPVWMKNGIPVSRKGQDFGFEPAE